MAGDVGKGLGTKVKAKVFGPAIGTLVMILVIAVVFTLLQRRFISVNNVTDMLKTSSIRFIVSLAMGIVIASGGFDLSVGHVAGFSGLIAAYMLVNLRAGIPLSISGGVAAGTLLGTVSGVIVGWLGVSSFITTLGMQMVIIGLRYWLTNGSTIRGFSRDFVWLGNGNVFGGMPVIVIIMFLIMIIMFFIMHRTTFGRRIVSVGQNMEASRFSGINPRIYTALALMVSGFLCGIAGVLIGARNRMVNVDVGDGYLLEAITIAVLAQIMFGKFKAHGVMLMTIFVVMLMNGLAMLGVSPDAINVIKGTMLIMVIGFGKYMQYLRNKKRPLQMNSWSSLATGKIQTDS
jgi:ribose/xylose/arabinose/galactoside ABC-type transport system permease subunit